MWDKIKVIIEKYFDLSFPVKFVVLSLAGSLGGSSYIAFLSEYATYYYAWTEGFRIPAEGSPYLKATIAAISFIVILSSLLVFLLNYIIGQSVLHMLTNQMEIMGLPVDVSRAFLRELSWKKVLLFAIGIGVFSGIGFGLDIYSSKGVNGKPILNGLGFGFFIFVLILILWQKKILVIFSSIVALLFFVTSPIALFNKNIYGSLLQELGYGGKLPILVMLPNEQTKTTVSLYLRTNTSIFVSNNSGAIVEYPISEIKYIEYQKQVARME